MDGGCSCKRMGCPTTKPGELTISDSPGSPNFAARGKTLPGFADEMEPCSPCHPHVEPQDVQVGDAVQAWLKMAPTPGSPCYETLHSAFPGALPGKLVLQRIAHATDKFGLTPENTIYGQSVCPDEINHEKGGLCHSMAEYWGECFPMGGIGGAPYVGKTGFGAFSNHVPDGGNVLILFGPHMAVSECGQLGKITRAGQSKLSTACGAVLAAHDWASKAEQDPDFDASDVQQWWLKQKIAKQYDHIKASKEPMEALIRVAYECTKEKLLSIVNNDYGTGHLVIVGGIQINLGAPFEDHFLPLMFQVKEKNGTVHDLMSAFELPKCGDMSSTTTDVRNGIYGFLSWASLTPPLASPCGITMQRSFPGAIPGDMLIKRLGTILGHFGLTPENTIYGESVCPDEINHEKGGLCHSMAEYWGECFPMGGIGGSPHVGKTGFGAFSNHVPDGGHVLVLFGPHIAVSSEGELCKILRVGQSQKSGACGAVLAAYASCCKGQAREFDPSDMQQSWLEQKVQTSLPKIKNAAEPMKELVNVAYESVKGNILEIVNNNFGDGHLVLVGGIQINLPAPYRDHFLPLHFTLRKKDGSEIDLLKRVHELDIGGTSFSLV